MLSFPLSSRMMKNFSFQANYESHDVSYDVEQANVGTKNGTIFLSMKVLSTRVDVLVTHLFFLFTVSEYRLDDVLGSGEMFLCRFLLRRIQNMGKFQKFNNPQKKVAIRSLYKGSLVILLWNANNIECLFPGQAEIVITQITMRLNMS